MSASLRRLGLLALVLVTPILVECAGRHPASTSARSDGGAYRRLAWLEGDVQNDYEPDRKVAETKLKGWEGKTPDPEKTDEYLEYLATLDASGRHAEAETRIRQYLAAHPDEKRAVFLLATHYLRVKKRELASYLFAGLEKDASFNWKSLLFNNLGMLALQDKNTVAAMGYFEKATQGEPPTPTPHVNLGALYLQSKSYADAEKLFRKAKELDGDFEDASLGLGVALEGQGKYEEAHKVYGDCMEVNTGALSVLYNDSILLGNHLKRREEAAQQMLRYIQRGGKETAKAHEIIQSWR